MRRRSPPPSPPPSEDDTALFRESIGKVRSIEVEARAMRPRPAPRATQRERDEAEALRASQRAPFELPGPEAPDALQFRRDGISERIWRALRRGQYAVQDEIDLHQLNATSAEAVLREFLRDCRARHHHCVRVIHGKGLHSKDAQPVLRNLVEGVLRRRSDVLAYSSAPAAMGGTGAVLVLLSRQRPTEVGPPE